MDEITPANNAFDSPASPSGSIRVLVVRTAGTNCDRELVHAWQLAGAQADRLHINALIQSPHRLHDYDILALPGGFSYGDDVGAGRILATRIRHRLMQPLMQFVRQRKPILGICNGFQVLVQLGLLPFGADAASSDLATGAHEAATAQQVSLTHNTLPRFVDRWVAVQAHAASPCIWTRDMQTLDLPIAHGEGRLFIPPAIVDQVEQHQLAALHYRDNPNGSTRSIAGLTDPTGTIFGLMPHPERALDALRSREHYLSLPQTQQPPAMQFFINAVEHVRPHKPAAVE